MIGQAKSYVTEEGGRYERFRRRIFETMDVVPDEHLTSRMFDTFMVLLILLNVVSVVLETEATLTSNFGDFFYAFEEFSLAVFTIEYLLRLWTCTLHPEFSHPITGRLRYILTPFALIDLVAILPFFIPKFIPFDLRFVRILRLFRLLRLLKLGRYSESLRVLGNVLRAKKEDLAVAGLVVLIVLVFASSLMYLAENEAQPNSFSSILATMWWGVATLTTVGYGDMYPITPLGKILGAIIAVSGIGLFALPAGILASGFAAELQKDHQIRICPHCGKDINMPPEKEQHQH